ncbi:hypothetical protein [Sphingorhabdus sp.]
MSGGPDALYFLLQASQRRVAYAKSDEADLTADEKKMVSALIEELTHD